MTHRVPLRGIHVLIALIHLTGIVDIVLVQITTRYATVCYFHGALVPIVFVCSYAISRGKRRNIIIIFINNNNVESQLINSKPGV